MFTRVFTRVPTRLPTRLIYLFCALCTLPLQADILEEVVVTASRSEQAVSEVAASIDVVNNISAIGPTHINETMQRVPGVWISRGNGQESLISIRSPVLTGAGGCGGFLTAEDGIPLRSSGFCNVNELFDVNSEQAARIEVLKGPGSVWYGSNAMHGMINVITPQPNNQNVFFLEGGPHDYYRGRLNLSGDTWRLDTNLTTDGGYKHDSGFDQQKASLKTVNTLGSFDATTVLSLSNLNQETAGFIQGTKLYEDSHASRQNPNPEAYRDSQTLRLHSQLSRMLDNGSRLSLTPFARSTRMTFIQHFLPGQATEENGHDSIGLQSALHFDQLTIGADLELTRAFLEEFQPNATNSGSAFLVGTIPSGQHYDYKVNASVLAIFANYQWELSARTRLDIGARLEQVRYDYDNRMLDGQTRDDGTSCGFGGCRFSRPADRDDDFTNLSPKLSLIHDLTEGHQLFVRLAQGYRAPQATELYRLQGGQSVSNIDAEEIDSIELGFRGALEDLDYSIAIYAMNKDNFIFRDSNRLSVDNGETSHRGIEMNLNYQWHPAWSANIVANYARHQYENNPDLSATQIKGNDIDTAPRKSGSVRLSWQPDDKFNTELEWVYLGRYYTNPTNSAEYGGHALVNLRTHYQWSESLTLFGRLINLAGEEYAERADFAFGNDRYFVGEPASIYLGFKTNF
ncbi:MAG: iron complex outermembrane receptor protein [Litorivivens sp.]|jgi:iron complex outermembrane receptor protein